MKISSSVLAATAVTAAKLRVSNYLAPNYNLTAVGKIFHPPKSNVTMSQVYGKVKEVGGMSPWIQRTKSKLGRPEKYMKTRQASECTFPLEVVLVQDTTESFQRHFEVMVNDQLPQMVENLGATHPGSTYGLVTFRDKPVWSLGVPDHDFCIHMPSPLNPDISNIYDIYNHLESYGGGDPSENQFGALHAVAQSDRPGWSNQVATRLIVLITDAPPHFEGDGYQAPEYNMAPFSGTFDHNNIDQQCVSEYYPGPHHVRDAIWGREAYVAFVIFDGNSWNELPTNSFKWFNSYIGQTDDFVEPLGNDSSNFWPALAEIIREIELVECGFSPSSSTTEEEVEEATTAVTESTTADNCPPCPDPCLPCSGECPPCYSKCGCPEVEIRLAHKPKHLQLEFNN